MHHILLSRNRNKNASHGRECCVKYLELPVVVSLEHKCGQKVSLRGKVRYNTCGQIGVLSHDIVVWYRHLNNRRMSRSSPGPWAMGHLAMGAWDQIATAVYYSMVDGTVVCWSDSNGVIASTIPEFPGVSRNPY